MSFVKFELHRIDDGEAAVAVVTLNDPDRRNVLSRKLVYELTEALDTLEDDPHVRSIVITGAQSAFCAGAEVGDLEEIRSRLSRASNDAIARLKEIYRGFLRVVNCSLPTIAAVNGPAIGAGLNLALACDLRLAGSSARFETRFLELGLHPGGGHSLLLQRAVGRPTATAMILFGERIDSDQAVKSGLVLRSVADSELLDEAIKVAARASRAPRDLSIKTKQTLRQVFGDDDLESVIDLEVQAQVWSLGQTAFAERIAMIRAKGANNL